MKCRANEVSDYRADPVCELPLKEHCETIVNTWRPNVYPDDHSNTMNRLTLLEGKLKKNPQLFKPYDEINSDYIQNGIVENEDEPETEGNAHEKETTKVHIVFDASPKRGK